MVSLIFIVIRAPIFHYPVPMPVIMAISAPIFIMTSIIISNPTVIVPAVPVSIVIIMIVVESNIIVIIRHTETGVGYKSIHRKQLPGKIAPYP